MSLPLRGFRLHRYSGRENGIMIVGTNSSLAELARAITEGINGLPEREDVQWPRHLCSLEDGPGRAPTFAVSFHLETLTAALPRERYSAVLNALFRIVFFLFAVIGSVTVLKWVNVALAGTPHLVLGIATSVAFLVLTFRVFVDGWRDMRRKRAEKRAPSRFR